MNTVNSEHLSEIFKIIANDNDYGSDSEEIAFASVALSVEEVEAALNTKEAMQLFHINIDGTVRLCKSELE